MWPFHGAKTHKGEGGGFIGQRFVLLTMPTAHYEKRGFKRGHSLQTTETNVLIAILGIYLY